MGKLHSIQQITDNAHLNFYAMEVEDRKGKSFSYYMASRAKTQAELKMNSGQGPDHPDGVVIYSLYGEKKDRVVLVRQYRYPLGGYIYEFPAGLVEPGEDFHAAGIRELREETGLEFLPKQVDPMYEKPFYTTIGMTDECCAMVFGEARGSVSREGLEDSEDLEIILADRQEVRRILKEERVALMCAYMLMYFLHEEEPFAFLER
ncbi:MAG: NUDIX hydrolase [Lachnospiraceae bacterium]|nr:NUDIX hydrolase [Lachnospiraceae bacterium]